MGTASTGICKYAPQVRATPGRRNVYSNPNPVKEIVLVAKRISDLKCCPSPESISKSM